MDDNPYSFPSVGTVCRNSPCGCRVGLLSDIEAVKENVRQHAGSLPNPWIVIPCSAHSERREALKPEFLFEACKSAADGAEVRASPSKMKAMAGNVAAAIQGEIWRMLDTIEALKIELDAAREAIDGDATVTGTMAWRLSGGGWNANAALSEASAILKEYGRGG